MLVGIATSSDDRKQVEASGRQIVALTQGVSEGPKMLAAQMNRSEPFAGDAEQPSCGE